jgi:hypothetical protein
MQQLNLLWPQDGGEEAHDRGISIWSIETGNETGSNRVDTTHEDNWNRSRCRLSCECTGQGNGGDYRNLTANQIARQRRQTIVLTHRPAVLDRDALTLDVIRFAQALMEGGQPRSV